MEGIGKRKWLAGAAVLAALFVTASFPVMAAGTVSSVRLRFTDRYLTGEIQEPDITCRTSGVSIDSVSWSKDVEDWKPGTKVTATILLSSEDEFLSSYGSRTMTIDGASLTGATRTGDNLKVTVSYYPVVQLDSPDEAGWSSLGSTTASWKSVKYATGYQIRLYRDNDFVRTIEATGTKKDLSEYMNKEGDYYYMIRAVGKNENDRKYRVSSEYLLSSDRVVEDLGDTEGKWRNYASGNKFQTTDGTYVVKQWYRIGGQWYYFDEDGFAVTGWKQVDGAWYYMNTGGVMQTGWQKIGDLWYYLNVDGDMATGWKETSPGKWYYLNADGSMAANTVIDGKHLDASGLCID